MKIMISTVLTLLLAGCSSIPYDPNKSHTQIASDLNIKEQDIKIASKCNFYPFEYGVKAHAKMRSCVFVATAENIFIVNYKKDEKNITQHSTSNLRKYIARQLQKKSQAKE